LRWDWGLCRGIIVIRRLFFASVVIGAFASGASAADLPVGPGAYYPGTVNPFTYYNWSGIYLGGNFGGASASQSSSIETDAVTGATFSPNSTSSSGFAGGGQVGINWFFSPSIVLGLEGDFDALSNDTSAISPDGSAIYGDKQKFLSTVRGRLGLTADRFMFYVTGGFAWGEEQVTRSEISGTVNNAAPGTVETTTRNRIGWTAGPGVEFAFAPNWIARLEYLYVHLDGVSYTFPLAERTVTVPSDGISLLRVGVSYKFNWSGSIAARD
jgi:outer membrane immunogenic protein